MLFSVRAELQQLPSSTQRQTQQDTIGDYQFSRQIELGKGGFGTVFQGVNTTTQETVAVKQVHNPRIIQGNYNS